MVEGPHRRGIGAEDVVLRGITKGVTAVGSMMMLAATRAGIADKLRAELERS